MDSTLYESTSFYGFTNFSYMVREAEGHKAHAVLRLVITFTDRCKSVSRLDGKHLGEDNCRFYASLRVAVSRCEISYCDKHEMNNDRRDAWKDLLEYYYGFIKNKKYN